MRTYLARIAREFRVVNYKLVDLTAEGDRVWSLSRGEFKSVKNGKRVKLDLVGRWTLRNGKVIAWEEFTDTAGALIQEGRLAKREKKRKKSA